MYVCIYIYIYSLIWQKRTNPQTLWIYIYIPLYGKRGFVDVIKWMVFRLSWIITGGPNDIITRVLMRGSQREILLQKQVMWQQKQEVRVMQGRGHEPSRMQVASRYEKRQETNIPLESPEGTSLVNTQTWALWNWFWTSSLQNYKRIDLCCFKPPWLW